MEIEVNNRNDDLDLVLPFDEKHLTIGTSFLEIQFNAIFCDLLSVDNLVVFI